MKTLKLTAHIEIDVSELPEDFDASKLTGGIEGRLDNPLFVILPDYSARNLRTVTTCEIDDDQQD